MALRPVVVWNCVGAELGGGKMGGEEDGTRKGSDGKQEHLEGRRAGWSRMGGTFRDPSVPTPSRREIGQTLLPLAAGPRLLPGLITPLWF